MHKIAPNQKWCGFPEGSLPRSAKIGSKSEYQRNIYFSPMTASGRQPVGIKRALPPSRLSTKLSTGMRIQVQAF
jgi:hypothetical protein